MLPWGFALMVMQGVAEVIKRVAGSRCARIDANYERPLQ